MGKAPAIPYSTVKAFRACMDILRNAPPAVVTREALVERGLSVHAVYPVLGTLRFLGIVDDEGMLQPAVAPFLDSADMDGRRQVFEQAYAAVLADVRFPVDDREEVDAILLERHGVAPGVAAFCSTFFLWLAAESGIAVADAGRARRGRPPAHLAQLSAAARAALLSGKDDSADLRPFEGPERPAELPDFDADRSPRTRLQF